MLGSVILWGGAENDFIPKILHSNGWKQTYFCVRVILILKSKLWILKSKLWILKSKLWIWCSILLCKSSKVFYWCVNIMLCTHWTLEVRIVFIQEKLKLVKWCTIRHWGPHSKVFEWQKWSVDQSVFRLWIQRSLQIPRTHTLATNRSAKWVMSG